MTLLALALALSGPDLEQALTYRNYAERLPVLLDRLGEQTGVKFHATAEAAKEVVLVTVKGKPLKVVLDRLAEATTTRYRVENREVWFKEDTAAQAKQDAKETEARATYLASLQKAVPHGLAAAAKLANSKSADPVELAHYQLALLVCQRLPVRLLAESGTPSRIVFSTQPTRMQVPLDSFGLEDAVAAVVAAHSRNDSDNLYADGPVTRIECAVTSPAGRINRPLVSITGLNRAGKVVLTFSEQFGYEGSDNMDAEESSPPPADDADKAVIPKFARYEPSDRTKRARKLLNSDDVPSKAIAKASADDLVLLTRPEANDPLSFGASDALLARAEREGTDLVADLADDWVAAFSEGNVDRFSPLDQTGHPDYNDKPNTQAVVGQTTLAVIRRGGGIETLSSAYPAEARRGRADRAGLARLMKAGIEKGEDRLDTLAAYALGAPPILDSFTSADDGSESRYTDFVLGLDPTYIYNYDQWDILRFWGILGTEGRKLLKDGQVLNGFRFNPEMIGMLHRALYYSSSQAVDVATYAPYRSLQIQGLVPYDQLRAQALNLSQKDDEPTDLCPNGVTANCQVKVLNTSLTNFFSVARDPDYMSSNGARMSVVALQVARTKVRPSSGATKVLDELATFYLGKTDCYQLLVNVENGYGLVAELQDIHPPDKSHEYTFDTMPADEKSKFAKVEANFEDRFNHSKVVPVPPKRIKP